MKPAGLAVGFQRGSAALVTLTCAEGGPRFIRHHGAESHRCHILRIPVSAAKQGCPSQLRSERSPRGTVLSDKPLSHLGLPLVDFFLLFLGLFPFFVFFFFSPPPFSLFSTAGTTGHSRKIFTHH